MQNIKADYNEFYNPDLVRIYDLVNPIEGYEEFYIEMAKKINASSIIDVGCGTGLLTCKLAENNYQITGIEPSSSLLDIARNRCKNQVQWREGKLGDMDVPQSDLVIMTGHVAQFFLDEDEWKNALNEIYRILKSGGYFIFESRNPQCLPFDTWPSRSEHREIISPEGEKIQWWAELLNENGNKVLYTLHYILGESTQELLSTNELIFRSKAELTQSLKQAGFVIESIFGDWDNSVFKNTSHEMIFIARKM